eukprot:CAMPEP_0172487104 /NCGR_PEP_ID=MMETSP1066-20121228/15996_1 /TAXON_ID=671091 /ORGANISM="Coscinodiscus wailesii, Strain CCMP2513" /LENGTH=240 /DNA_ID=CAMNT_0013253499 /DNA_START=72 /DNA_END=791 /DNA_ORIENTATION=+
MNVVGSSEGVSSRSGNDAVANALSEITEASPYELAEYVRLLVSTTQQSVNMARDIGKILQADGMVTVSGKRLEDALNNAISSMQRRGDVANNKSPTKLSKTTDGISSGGGGGGGGGDRDNVGKFRGRPRTNSGGRGHTYDNPNRGNKRHCRPTPPLRQAHRNHNHNHNNNNPNHRARQNGNGMDLHGAGNPHHAPPHQQPHQEPPPCGGHSKTGTNAGTGVPLIPPPPPRPHDNRPRPLA